MDESEFRLPRSPKYISIWNVAVGERPRFALEESMKLLRHMFETLAIALFSMLLPFLMAWAIIWGRNRTGVDADAVWFIKAAGTVLLPFGAVFWYIAVSHILFRRRSSYFIQFLVFVGTVGLIALLLKLGVYNLS